jgi:hypothetical protein
VRPFAPTPFPTASIALTLAVVAVVVGGVDSPVRPALVIPFLLLAPGMAAVRLLRIPDPTAVFMLAVAVSLVVAGLVAGIMVYTGNWSPTGGLVGLALFTVTANVADILVSTRRSRAT